QPLERIDMSGWPGTMGCVVINITQQSMANVSVSHQWTDNPQQIPDALDNISLAPGESSTFTITVGPGGGDLWSVFFFLASSNQTWIRNDKQCDVRQEDSDSDIPVTVNLNFTEAVGAFDIVTPVSSPCLNNSMDAGA